MSRKPRIAWRNDMAQSWHNAHTCFVFYNTCAILMTPHNRRAMVDIHDQVWLVTGASSGIGRAVASTLARRGARVVLAARSMPLLQQLADELTRDGAQAIAVSMDVCRDDSVAAGIDQALSGWEIGRASCRERV